MPKTEAHKAAMPFGGAIPIFRVSSLAASIDHYVHLLGFKVNWRHPFFASVSRGGCNIFLSEGDQGNPGSWAWIGVEDAQALFEELQNNKVAIRHLQRITNGRMRCRSKIPTATCSASARTRKRINPSANGSTCTAAAGRCRSLANGHGSKTNSLDLAHLRGVIQCE